MSGGSQQAAAPPAADYEKVRRGGQYGFVAILLDLIGIAVTLVSRAAGMVVGLVALVLLLLALRDLSEALGEPRIFSYGVYALVVSLAGALVALVAAAGAVLSVGPAGLTGALVGALVAALAVIYVVLVISGYFVKRIYEMLSDRSSPLSARASEDFGRAARWYWIGVLLVVILVGVALVIVGQVYALMGFRELESVSPPAAGQGSQVI